MNKKGTSSGLGKVYRFTLSQLYKNKANMVTFIILVAIAAFAIPVLSFFMGSGNPDGATFYTSVMTMEDFLNRDTVDSDARYTLQYAYSIIVMIVCIFSTTYIVRAIIEEKTSKLVETLMVSIRSDAMILGKILAVITFVFSMIISAIAAFAASYLITGIFRDVSFVSEKLEAAGITSEMFHLGLDIFFIIIFSALLACVSLSLIAALSGAGCSSMEDMESANMAATMIILACYMATVIIAPLGSGAAVFMSLCPFLSCFAAPAYYMTGDIGIGILASSWLIQAVCIFIIYRLSGRVYDSLIIYKGSRLKMGAIFGMAVSRKEGK